MDQNYKYKKLSDILDIEKMAIAEHPDVLAAEINIKRARSDIESKKRAFGPSLALSGSLTKTDTNNKHTDGHRVCITAKLKFFDMGRRLLYLKTKMNMGYLSNFL
mgnify:CR=1 FL=1